MRSRFRVVGAVVAFGVLALVACSSDYASVDPAPGLDAGAAPDAADASPLDAGARDANDATPSLMLTAPITSTTFDATTPALTLVVGVVATHLDGPVTLTLSGLPDGIAAESTGATVDDPSETSGAIFRLSRVARATIGKYPLTVSASSNGITATTTFTLGVTYADLTPGMFDTSFNGGVPKVFPSSDVMYVSPSGQVHLVTSSAASSNFSVVRLDIDGNPDPTWGTAGIATLAGDVKPNAIAVDAKQGLLVSGATASGAYLLRFDKTGAPDPTFNGNTGSRSYPSPSPDHVYSGGQVAASSTRIAFEVTDSFATTSYNSTLYELTDEGLDYPGFTTPVFTDLSSYTQVMFGPGDFITGVGYSRTLDSFVSSFDASGGESAFRSTDFDLRNVNRPQIIGVTADRHVSMLLSGNTPTGATLLVMARFDATGKLDPTFGTNGSIEFPLGTATDLYLEQVIPLADGRFFAIGAVSINPFSSGDDSIFVARFLADGTFDPSFGTGGIAYYPNSNSVRMAAALTDKWLVIVAEDGTTSKILRIVP